jgi:signal transduction histidine kinase
LEHLGPDLLQARTLRIVTLAAMIAAPPLIFTWVAFEPSVPSAVLALLTLLVFPLHLARMSFRTRAIGALAVAFVLSLGTLVAAGIAGGSFMGLTLVVVLAIALLGARAGVWTAVACTATVMIVGAFVVEGVLPMPPMSAIDPTHYTHWVRAALAFAVGVGFIAFIVALALRSMERHAVERQEAERRLVEAQKVEALGRLAGGAAHEFNNSLLVILSWTDAMRGRAVDEPTRQAVEAISQAASQASRLTRQLLVYARGEHAEPKRLDVNAVVEANVRSFARLLGRDIDVRFTPGEAGAVVADEAQLGQVLLNLALNARDAMPGGGRLELATKSDAESVSITVHDTGVGMDEATRARVFEPYFTTKGSRGTGLGLAQAQSIVEQAKGSITVDSAPGHGTTFTITLPAAAANTPPPEGDARPLQGTVLLTDDDELVRRAMASALREGGFDVLEASDGAAALALARRHRGTIDLLCTDAVMPGLAVGGLVDGFRELFPEAAVLVCSGFADDVDVATVPELARLQKPFGGGALVRKVHELLATRAGERARAASAAPAIEPAVARKPGQ